MPNSYDSYVLGFMSLLIISRHLYQRQNCCIAKTVTTGKAAVTPFNGYLTQLANNHWIPEPINSLKLRGVYV